MNKNFQVVGGSLLGALALMAVSVMPASAADEGSTTTTFVVAGGSLDVAVAGTATLTPVAPGTLTVSGSLGNVDVSDTRGSTAGWSMSAASSTFTSTSGIGETAVTSTSTGVSLNTGAATASTGTVTPTSTGATSVAAEAPVAAGTAASGNNTARYAPQLTVSLPAQALAGTYTGTVTTSVA